MAPEDAPEPEAGLTPESRPAPEDAPEPEAGLTPEKRRLAEEKKNERYVWWFLAYFLFGIHIVAFVMIYAVTHAK
ncbi:hypothetical protein [Streptomyces europaeiscabiei]|uniref:hypothetical protein n=1 Tax=Streptomyces europaeiscabiei TaxID=146819 RepID=UPI0029AE2F2B|nr:hypothetical protein [Streptomyces europaeiscabiei]MDX2766262.1 hypothetical protein [Streptomyces europaeiscabiei]MDX3784464.1 hypothetical protein [Streptomyces europaeiscabiei]